MEKYLELDKKIMVKIRDNPVPFSLLFVRDSDIANECEKIASEEGKTKEPYRILDRRLQALRKSGEHTQHNKGLGEGLAMTVQLTKEWLQQEIMRLEAGLDREDAYRTDDDGQRTLAAFRLALVSIDNEPVEESGIFYPGDAVGVFNIGNKTCPDHMVAWTVKGQNLPNGVYWLYLHPPKQKTVELYDYDELKGALEKIISENWKMREVLRDLLNKRPGGVYFKKWESVIYEALSHPVTDAWRSRILAEFFPVIIPVEIRDQIIDYCEGAEICDAAAQHIWDVFRTSALNPAPKCNGGV